VRVRTDDEVYRVDAVWLGPPKATFPWRARYVAWGVGIVVFLVVMTVERRMGFGFGFFTTAWAFIATVILTRFITARISHERPLGAVITMWVRELTAPRERAAGLGGAASASRLKVNAERPGARRRRGNRRPERMTPPRHGGQQRRSAGARTKEVRGVRTPRRP
jgi:hypothetical protein